MSATRSTAAAPDVPAYLVENPYAGQGPVLLEIGADSGALVLSAPEALVGEEIEIRAPGHGHPHGHSHGHAHGTRTPHPHAHAAVIPRPLPSGGVLPCAVYADLSPGVYTLHLMPGGPSMSVAVGAGEVTLTRWDPGA